MNITYKIMTLEKSNKNCFKENESYKHKMAKEVLKEWFYGGNGIGDIGFYPNRECGVWFEYPIVNDEHNNSVDYNWDEFFPHHNISYDEIEKCYRDENLDELRKLGLQKLDEIEEECRQNEYVPTFDECIKVGIYPKRVVDVVLPHKGSPRWFIEICHKNPTSNEKIDELRKLGVENLIEIDAEWIMKQTGRPSEIEYKRLI